MLVAAVMVTLVVLTGSVTTLATGVPEPPADPDVAVLQVKEWRSLVGPSERAELPEVTILGGGRVIVPTGQDGAVQRATEHTLDAERYRYVYRLAHRAGLARDQYLRSGPPPIDGSLLVVTLRSGGRTYTTKAVTDLDEFRRTLRALVADARAVPYRPAGYAALVTGGFGSEEAQPWPGEADLSAGTDTYIGTCTVIGSAPPEATRTAQWHSGGHRLWVTLRPLLPYESTCADVEGQRP
jgi:hypothetical protein